MSAFLSDFGVRFGVSTMLVAGLICVLAASEIAFPRGQTISFEARRRAIAFSLLYLASVSISGAAVSRLIYEAGLTSSLIKTSGVATAIAAALCGDFFYYWYHRAEHSMGWLWRIHSVHHSAEQLGAGSGFHHLAEGPLKALLVGAPTGLLVSRTDAGVFSAILTMQAVYIHSSTRLNFGRFRWLVCDNHVHRIHHSREARHFDKNFGAFTLVWDRLFGTAYLPGPNEWPEVGLAGQPEPRKVRGLLTLRRPAAASAVAHTV